MKNIYFLIALLFITTAAVAQSNSYTTVEDFETERTNSTVYALKNARSPIYFNTSNNELAAFWTDREMEQQGGLIDVTNTAQQFAFLRTKNTVEGMYYMYSVEGGCFITLLGQKSETPVANIFFKDVTGGVKLYIGTEGDNVVNVTYWNTNISGGIRYNVTENADEGNTYELVAYDKEVDLGAAMELINKFEGNIEVETAIESIEIQSAETVIHDLTGRMVDTITKAGIYIANGKKAYIK